MELCTPRAGNITERYYAAWLVHATCVRHTGYLPGPRAGPSNRAHHDQDLAIFIWQFLMNAAPAPSPAVTDVSEVAIRCRVPPGRHVDTLPARFGMTFTPCIDGEAWRE